MTSSGMDSAVVLWSSCVSPSTSASWFSGSEGIVSSSMVFSSSLLAIC